MGIGRASRASTLVTVLSVASLCACGLDSEPAQMCGELDLTTAQTRAFDHDSPTVVALSDGAGRITVVRSCEVLEGAFSAACQAELISQTIDLNDVPDQLLLTASGRWLTYRVGGDLYRLDLDHPEPEQSKTLRLDGVHEIIGSLRGGDWLIYRTWGDQPTSTSVGDSELWAYYAGEEDVPRPHFRIGEGLGSKFDLRVAAMGHRHVVARRILGNGEEELYLVRIAPARRHDELGSTSLGKPLLLARGKRFTRVLITTGLSPAEHGDPWEFQHDVPTDVRVIATSGSGADARTLIYSVSDTGQIANFEGAVVSSPVALEDTAGLSAVSPSGTHLAYITPRGSLALRDLDSHSACMIRPATGARHLVAGFAADGTMYFESRERGSSEINGAAGADANIVYAYDPAAEEFTALTDDRHTWRLYAVPPQRYETEEGALVPWAVVALDGFYAARPDAKAQALYYEDVSFLPRGDESLWLLEGEESDGFDDPHSVTIRRVQPTSGNGDAIEFDAETADPSVLENGAGEPRTPFTRTYTNKSTICVSTSQSASRTTPWATSCSTPDKPTSYLDSGLPQGEHD